MKKIHIVEAESPNTPGRYMRAYTTKAGARLGAVDATNAVLQDIGEKPDATLANYKKIAKRLEAKEGGYVDVYSLSVQN